MADHHDSRESLASQVLINRLKASQGCADDALAAVYQRYFLRLAGLIRSRLGGQFQSRVDADDLAQSAFGSFLNGYAQGKLSLEDRESLWPLLALIAVRKYCDLLDRYHAQSRDIAREASLSAADESLLLRDAAATHAPLEELAALETVALIQSRLDDDRQQQILRLRLEGCTVEEISQQVELSTRTVKRVLQKIRTIWEELCGQQPPQRSDDDQA